VHAALYDPEVQRSYREFAEHYGFLIAPCRPRTPEHKDYVAYCTSLVDCGADLLVRAHADSPFHL
jgi:transposase